MFKIKIWKNQNEWRTTEYLKRLQDLLETLVLLVGGSYSLMSAVRNFFWPTKFFFTLSSFNIRYTTSVYNQKQQFTFD